MIYPAYTDNEPILGGAFVFLIPASTIGCIDPNGSLRGVPPWRDDVAIFGDCFAPLAMTFLGASRCKLFHAPHHKKFERRIAGHKIYILDEEVGWSQRGEPSGF
jgi:hypothetical protein